MTRYPNARARSACSGVCSTTTKSRSSFTELTSDFLADASEAAKDVVILELFDLQGHSPQVEAAANVTVECLFDYEREGVQRRAHADQDENHREQLGPGVERRDFPETHRAEGRDGLVERVDQRHRQLAAGSQRCLQLSPSTNTPSASRSRTGTTSASQRNCIGAIIATAKGCILAAFAVVVSTRDAENEHERLEHLLRDPRVARESAARDDSRAVAPLAALGPASRPSCGAPLRSDLRLPGHGSERTPRRALPIHDEVRDVIAVMDAEGLERAGSLRPFARRDARPGVGAFTRQNASPT